MIQNGVKVLTIPRTLESPNPCQKVHKMGITATKLKKKLLNFKKQKVISIEAIYNARRKSNEAMKTIKTPDQLKGYNTTHAFYTYTQNFISYLSENLSSLT